MRHLILRTWTFSPKVAQMRHPTLTPADEIHPDLDSPSVRAHQPRRPHEYFSLGAADSSFQLQRPEWMEAAACRGMEPTDFVHSPRGAVADARALAVCATCWVQSDCLDFAIAHDCLGIWGGTSERRRRMMRRDDRELKA
jgi:WhiB family redox-sensing transcriptional regulator